MSTRGDRPCRGIRHQAGAALIVALVMLLVMTILGISSLQNATLRERMAGNVRDRHVALQAAEAGLRAGEDYLAGNAAPGPFNGSDGLYRPAEAPPPHRWSEVDWDDGDAVRTQAVGDTEAVYIVEELGSSGCQPPTLDVTQPPSGQMYRITARATGVSGKAIVMLQSSYCTD